MAVSVSIYAGVIDGIAVVVNNEPITLYEIKKTQKQFKFSNEQAVNFLVKRKVEDNLINERRIEVNEYEINDRFKQLAKREGLSLAKFQEMIRRQSSLEHFNSELTKQIQREKLYQMILRSEIKKPTDDELLAYYRNNIGLFKMPTHVEVIKYTAYSQSLLRAVLQNPMLQNPDLKQEEEKIDLKKTSRALLEVILKTKESSFSPILPLNKNLFMLLYVKNKIGAKKFDFESSKDKVLMIYYKTRESTVLRSFFNKQIADSVITIIR